MLRPNRAWRWDETSSASCRYIPFPPPVNEKGRPRTEKKEAHVCPKSMLELRLIDSNEALHNPFRSKSDFPPIAPMNSYSALSFLFLAQLCLANNLPRDIFILAGQSNMAGRGGVSRGRWDGRVPQECRPSSSVLRLDAHFGWELAKDPLHSDIDYNRTCGVGPGMPFANAVLGKDLRIGVVGLVPCAVGGTKIRRWSKGSSLYDQLLTRARDSTRDDGRIRAILWYHGESDTNVRSDAENYKANMRKFIGDLRTDLNDPTLLIIQVALASGEGKYVETVRRAQLELGEELPNVKCVDAKGLRLKEDGLHLTTKSQVHLGLMLADAVIAASK